MAEERVRVCIDRVVPDEYNPARASTARSMAVRMSALDPNAVVRPRMALPILKMWEAGIELKCRFLDGSTKQKKKVEAKAHLWEEHAGVTFKFVNSTDEQIRISFMADDGSWSALGTDCLIERYFPRFQPTMNYGWLEDNTPDAEYNRVVLHEFGHALGCIHEHQNPKAKLKWNKAEVYRVFSGPPNFWTKEQIDHNILNRYSMNHMNASAFDPASIMLYHFPGSFFTNGVGTSQNDTLSALDKSFIGQMYPKEA